MLKRSAAVVLLALLGAAILVAPARAADSPAYVVTVSGHDDPIVGDNDYLWRNGDGSNLEVSGSVDNLIQIYVDNGPADSGAGYFLRFYPKNGDNLATGTYSGTIRVPDATHPGLALLGHNTVCDATGSFTVKDLAPDLSHLWITYEMSCGGHSLAFGEVRYNLPSADSELTTAPDALAFPSMGIRDKETVPVTLVNTSPDPVTVSSVVATGDADFSVVGNSCAVIPVGGTCHVDVQFAPAVAGARSGTLTVTDSTIAGSHTIPLSGTAETVPVTGALSLDGASPYLYGQTVTATGTLSGSWVDPTVSIYTKVGTGPQQLVGTGGVDDAGQFSVQLPVTAAETFLLEWSDGAQSGSDSKSVTVEPVQLSVSLDHIGAPYGYGQSAKVTVLLTGSASRTFKLYKAIGSGARQLVTTTSVSTSTRKALVLVPVRSKTTFTAEWVDGTKKVTSAAKVAAVAAHVTVAMTGYSRLSSGYAVYRPGRAMGTSATVLVPHSGGCVIFSAQIYLNSHWQDYAYTHCTYTNSAGVARAYLSYSTPLRGKRMRFQAYFKGDHTNTRSTSPWKYARWTS